ncbi:MAG: TIR domain-containing protein [Vicinamibacterales bacterium]
MNWLAMESVAFISYSSADRLLGEQFQRAIEHYRIPKPLRGADRGAGVIPKYLTPLFRDRSDASAGEDLGATLEKALEDSGALIVLCSPASARSKYVNHEIRRFKALGRDSRIISVIVDGTPRRYDPATAPDGAFPPALFERVDALGTVLDANDAEPLAADIRPAGDGFEFAKLKVVAALTGVTLTELTERQFEAQRRERAIAFAVAGVMATLAVAAGIAAVVAYRAADEARTRLSQAIDMAARRVDDSQRFADEYGVPVSVIRQLLAGADQDFTNLLGADETGAPMLELERGRLRVQFSRFYGTIGDREQQLKQAEEGVAILDGPTVGRQLARPSSWFATVPAPERLEHEQLLGLEARALAVAASGGDETHVMGILEEGRDRAIRAGRQDHVARFWTRIGERHYLQANLTEAREAQDAALAALTSFLASNAGMQPTLERAAALSDRAQLLMESERHQEAFDDHAEVVLLLEKEAAANPSDNNARQSLAQALTRNGDMRYGVTGDWDASIPDFEKALAIFQEAYDSDPARADFARNLSIALDHMGDVMLQRLDTATATTYFDRSLAIRRQALARFPQSAEARRDVMVSLERQGDIALAEGNVREALASYDEARSIRTAGPTTSAERDLVLERDLALLWSRTGTARSLLSLSQPWREAHETSIDLMTSLTRLPDAPAGWLRDLAVLHTTYAQSLRRAGRTAEAREHLGSAHELIVRQLEINPADPRLQADRIELEGLIAEIE